MIDGLIIDVNVGSPTQWFNDRINEPLIESLFRFIDASMFNSIVKIIDHRYSNSFLLFVDNFRVDHVALRTSRTC
jgi:hypothetical protein